MVQRGRRAVYEPEALAFEKPTPTNETEYRRKVRMFEHCWLIVLRGKMLRRLGPLYALQIVSHRLLRYGSGLLHLVLLATSIALVTHGWVYAAVLAGRSRCSLAAAARRRDRPLLRARDLGDRRRARELPAARCARDLGSRGRARAEPRPRRRDRRRRARGREPVPRARRRSPSSSRTAGRCSTARRGSARTARTSSC